MNHVEAHKKMSSLISKLEKGEVKPQLAQQLFNGYGKLISNTKNELLAIRQGFPMDVPMLGIRQVDVINKLQIKSSKKKKLASRFES
jgi:hypothetical protein